MAAKTKFISFRIRDDVAEEVEAAANAAGISPNAFACEVLLEKLHAIKTQAQGISEVYEEVRRLRADLAKATEAVLTVANRKENPQERAANWVRKNLNH
jgi:hypothetical protein